MSNKNKNTKTPKGGKKDNKATGEENVIPPTEPTTPDLPDNPVAAEVIKHFSVRWKTFTEGLATDVATLSTTVNDRESGLVRKVMDLQTSVHEIKEGKKG